MVDLQPTNAALAAAPSANIPALTAVQVTLIDITQALSNLTRSIQINATPVALDDKNATLTLTTTSLGTISVVLGQQLSLAEKQNLLQQLINLVTAQKPLTLTLQPGSPPTQAVLLLPLPLAETATVPPSTILSQPFPLVSGLSLAVGDQFSAIVLPQDAAAPPSVPVNIALPVRVSPAVVVPPAPVQAGPLLAASVAVDNVTHDAVAPPNAPVYTASPIQLSPAVAAPSAPVAPIQVAPVSGAAILTTSATVVSVPSSAPLPTPQTATQPISQKPQILPQQVTIPQITTQQMPQATAAQTPSASVEITAPPVNAKTVTMSLPPFSATQSPPQPAVQATNVGLATAPQSQAVASLALPSPPAPTLQPGANVTVHVVSILPPDIALAQLPSLPADQSIATVTATGTSGNLVLKTDAATLFVKASVAAPVGAQLVVTIEPAKSAPPIVIRPLESDHFSALPQALAALEQIAPSVAAQVFAAAVPQPTPALPGVLMFFFSAFKQGNVRRWLGDEAVETLVRSGKSDMIDGLSRALSEGGQPVHDNIVGQWKSYPLPLYAQQQFQTLNLYVHSDRQPQQGQNTPDDKTRHTLRFLIDMRLSKLGAMQVDGFIRDKKLDMVLRSENNLPLGLHHELRDAYARAVGAVGYAGSLNFQIGRRHWMVMQPPPIKGIVT